ncbi:hypothetical protein [Streptomyces ureilyticus]|uniref:hypothetical protein n=1 Tax=Streptomyces ureilyticus TaxID=1775131 RepID=UPI0019D10C4B|nr:hypothetical protein [Streptomyces ureilyticus]
MTEPTTSAVEQAVQQRIAAARIKVQAARERRDELSTARRAGLARRHAQKLRRLADAEQLEADEDDLDDGGQGDEQHDHQLPAATAAGQPEQGEAP